MHEAVRRPRGPDAGLRRRRQQRRPLARHRLRQARRALHPGGARAATASTSRSWRPIAGTCPKAELRRERRPAPGRRRGRRRSTPTSGPAWARRTRRDERRKQLRRVSGERRAAGAGPDARQGHALPAGPPRRGGHRRRARRRPQRRLPAGRQPHARAEGAAEMDLHGGVRNRFMWDGSPEPSHEMLTSSSATPTETASSADRRTHRRRAPSAG